MNFTSRHSHYLIDLDDTLIKEKDYLIQAYKEIDIYLNKKYNVKLNSVYLYLLNEFELNGRKFLFDKLNKKFQIPINEIGSYLKILRNFKVKNKLKLTNKGLELLRYIINNQKNYYIVTNGNVIQQKNKISNIDWIDIKSPKIVYANDYFPKPDQRLFFNFIQAKLNVNVSDILFIGDSKIDKQFASNIGCDFKNIKNIKFE